MVIAHKLNRKEVEFFIRRFEAFGLRFTCSEKVICKNFITDQWDTMRLEDAKELMKEWYRQGRKHSKYLDKPVKRLPQIIDDFINVAFIAVKQYDQEQLERHHVNDDLIDVEAL